MLPHDEEIAKRTSARWEEAFFAELKKLGPEKEGQATAIFGMFKILSQVTPSLMTSGDFGKFAELIRTVAEWTEALLSGDKKKAWDALQPILRFALDVEFRK